MPRPDDPNTYPLQKSDIPPELKLHMFLAEHVLGWDWMDGPTWDYHGGCLAHRVLAPAYAHARDFVWPPKGVILSHHFVDAAWTTRFDHAYDTFVHHLKAFGWSFDLHEQGRPKDLNEAYLAGFERICHQDPPVRCESFGPTAAMAICLAAKEVGEWALETNKGLFVPMPPLPPKKRKT